MSIPKSSSLAVMILCGGKGSRLQSVVSDRPKSMALIHGRPFLEWQLFTLRQQGFKDIVLGTGYMGWKIREYFGDGHNIGLHIRYSDEQGPMGTGGAIRLAWSLLQTESALVLNGDSWCDVDVAKLIHFHEERDAIGTLALTKMNDSQRYGHVTLDDRSTVIAFSEKGQTVSSDWINAGMYVLSRSLVASIPEHANISLEHEVFPRWVEKGLYGYAGAYEFFDIGTPASYAQAEQDFDRVFHHPLNDIQSVRQTV